MNHKRSIRNYVIEPFKQIKFGIYILTLCSFFLITSIALTTYAFFVQYEQIMEMFHVVDPNLRWELVLNDVFYQNGLMILSFYFVFIAGLMSMVFILTHRIYGPLVNIHRFIDELKKGNYACRISLRKKDELQKLASELNQLAEELEEKNDSNQ